MILIVMSNLVHSYMIMCIFSFAKFKFSNTLSYSEIPIMLRHKYMIVCTCLNDILSSLHIIIKKMVEKPKIMQIMQHNYVSQV